MTNTAAVTAEIIWDRDHGPENEGYYVRLHRADGQLEDIQLDAADDLAAHLEVRSMYPDVTITRCDEAREVR